jgi:multidrug efflux pump subunit AcrA (membrane-fusion protein)
MERARRRSQLRTWVVAGAVGVFAALWAGIFGQLAAGRDPGLSKSSAASTPAVTATGSSTPEASSPDSSYSYPDTSSSPAPVTTSQS